MDDRKKMIGMIVLCCLLFLFAGVRFWSMAADSRQQAELNSRNSPIQQRIVSKYEPRGMALKDPFGDLGLSDEQRRKIDDIMNESMPKLPPPGASGDSKRPNVFFSANPGSLPPPGANGAAQRHNVRMILPMDKIRAILTPEQQRKFDQMHSESGKPGDTPGKMLMGGPPPPGASIGGPGPGSGGMFIMRRRGPEGAP